MPVVRFSEGGAQAVIHADGSLTLIGEDGSYACSLSFEQCERLRRELNLAEAMRAEPMEEADIWPQSYWGAT